jgi:hypothetical protein
VVLLLLLMLRWFELMGAEVVGTGFFCSAPSEFTVVGEREGAELRRTCICCDIESNCLERVGLEVS